MNAIIRSSLFFLFLCAGTALAADTVHVAGSRELRLAIVDNARASAARDASHAAFAACLGEAVSKQCGTELRVRTKCVSADHAAFNLGTGVYDAVLVLTGSLPRPLITTEVSRLSATLGAGRSEKKVYLIFSNLDPSLSNVLSGSFAAALTSTKFLDSLDGGGDGKITASGAKIAASP